VLVVVSEIMLTLWKPTDETVSLLREGRRFHIFHLMARYTR